VAREFRFDVIMGESRPDVSADSFADRRERVEDMMMRVSCSERGDGPGTGGRGAHGGREGGGFREDVESRGEEGRGPGEDGM
jgi:hypothetical protein